MRGAKKKMLNQPFLRLGKVNLHYVSAQESVKNRRGNEITERGNSSQMKYCRKGKYPAK
jgi:hypothetical protein